MERGIVKIIDIAILCVVFYALGLIMTFNSCEPKQLRFKEIMPPDSAEIRHTR